MKKRTIYTAMATVMFTLGGIGAYTAYAIDHHVISQAEERLKKTLSQVQNTENIEIEAQKQSIKLPEIQGVAHRVPEFEIKQQSHINNDPLAIAQHYQQQLQADFQAAQKGDLLVFVSFSMPEASLKRIAYETGKAGGVMVLRGFKDNSLRKTVAAMEELAALQGELMIHPDLFRHYNITEVPSTVLAYHDDEKNCSNHESEAGLCTEHYQVKGDISLHAALEYFLEKPNKHSKLHEIAASKLAVLQGKY